MRYWSILFALAAVFSIGAFVYAPFAPDWWLPNAPAASWLPGTPGESFHTVSTSGREVDSLFLIILWMTGLVFIGTQIALVWVAWNVYIFGQSLVSTDTGLQAFTGSGETYNGVGSNGCKAVVHKHWASEKRIGHFA